MYFFLFELLFYVIATETKKEIPKEEVMKDPKLRLVIEETY